MKDVFSVCRKYNLRLNPEKCKFLSEKVKFLGRIIDNQGYLADPENIKAVQELTPPTNKKQLQQAVGRFCWLREFISTNVGEEVAKNCFSNLMIELTKLNKKRSQFSLAGFSSKSI